MPDRYGVQGAVNILDAPVGFVSARQGEINSVNVQGPATLEELLGARDSLS